MSNEAFELYVYDCPDVVTLIETRAAEVWNGDCKELPAILWLEAKVGVRTAALWWSAMGTRECTEEVRFVAGHRLEVDVAGLTETWPEHAAAALEQLADREEQRVAEVLMELSFNQAERELVKGGAR